MPEPRLAGRRYARALSDPALYERYERVFGELEPPFAWVDLEALELNARDMLAMGAGKPIRVASKSVRSRSILRRVLDLDQGFRGLLTFTLPESLWLFEHGFRDLVCAYPTADRTAIRRLGELSKAEPEHAPAIMVDSTEHLDLIEAAAGEGAGPVRVAIEIDVGWWALGGRVRIGPKRSAIRTATQARALAEEIERRAGVRLVGLMAYEGHVAGVGDDAPGKRLRNLAVRAMQDASMREIVPRRGEIVAAVREVAPLEFVNGGGTGSLARTASEPAVTEVAAGSGLYDPVLFDGYRSLELRPAAGFALPVSRRAGPGLATLLGGGYVASGPAGKDRLPQPYLPPGLRLDSFEGAGEVQTPVLGDAADRLRVGARVYMRHAKAGELCERFDSLHLVAGEEVVDVVPTYRGEGKAFL
jgi:D-serine deaminase-like pyridoxal phosphate-dependent protein